MALVLVVDDDRSVRHMLTQTLESINYEVATAETAEQALVLVAERQPDVVLLDIMLPGRSGLDVLRDIQSIDRRLPVIFVTADSGSSTAIEAMQLGAYDYVSKPLDLPQLNRLVESAIDSRRLMSVPVALSVDSSGEQTGKLFVGRSPEILDVFKSIGRVAAQDVPVLIRGESGTGKELVAQALYQHSHRRGAPFMAINCAALPDTLLESELFGHEKGAFTGADRRRIGKFEQCHGGTIFLDEVGDMAPIVQGKVLRLLQDQRFERVGGNETIGTDVRVITATNRPLEEMVESKAFRADLLYRLNGMTIFLPPVRQRREDVPLLLKYFLSRALQSLNKTHIEGMSPECLEILMSYSWPGNVREMQSVVQQAVLNAIGPIIIPEFLPREVTRNRSAEPVSVQAKPTPAAPTPTEGSASPEDSPTSTIADLGQFVDEQLKSNPKELYNSVIERVERYLFTRVLQETNGNQSQAAEILGVTRGKIRDRIATFNISMERKVRSDLETGE
ncbi:sigma-54-dependent transcriptional regulator [Schlesneria sp. T3-172]|uniref:sigma-54-dependent transcriptional regulator n=2 Tax=Schlesneria TaxID=656899 RepID=UPI0037CB99FA